MDLGRLVYFVDLNVWVISQRTYQKYELLSCSLEAFIYLDISIAKICLLLGDFARFLAVVRYM